MGVKKNVCTLECPKCLMPFATLTWEWDKPVTAKNFKFSDGKTKLRQGDDLTCTHCHYVYRQCDVMLAMMGVDAHGNKKRCPQQ